jgi:hypothetical protein
MLFVRKDLREKIEESTHNNILKNNVTLIYLFLWKSWEVVNIHKCEDLFLQLFFLDFL